MSQTAKTSGRKITSGRSVSKLWQALDQVELQEETRAQECSKSSTCFNCDEFTDNFVDASRFMIGSIETVPLCQECMDKGIMAGVWKKENF